MTTTIDHPAIATPAAQPAPLKLSEAIRLGSLLSRQCHRALRLRNTNSRFACAIGAAGDAIGKGSIAEICDAFPILNSQATHPVLGYTGVLANIIVDLNDGASWTREKIADYAESVEREAA